MNLKVGDKSPEFNLPDQTGKTHTLEENKGKWVLLYFYPQDDTPGCTAEACSLRDNLPHFDSTNAQIFGVSSDSVESHKKFVEKYNLNFTLLSDEGKDVIKAYDSLSMMGTIRNSFLIDPNGNIAKIYEKVNPKVHAAEVLADLNQLKI